MEQELKTKYQHLREEYSQEQQMLSLDEARKQKKNFFEI